LPIYGDDSSPLSASPGSTRSSFSQEADRKQGRGLGSEEDKLMGSGLVGE